MQDNHLLLFLFKTTFIASSMATTEITLASIIRAPDSPLVAVSSLSEEHQMVECEASRSAPVIVRAHSVNILKITGPGMGWNLGLDSAWVSYLDQSVPESGSRRD
jgi:hypothetical protein